MTSLRKQCTRLVVLLAAGGLAGAVFVVLARQVLLFTHPSALVLWGGLVVALALALGAGAVTWRIYRAWEQEQLPDRWDAGRKSER